MIDPKEDIFILNLEMTDEQKEEARKNLIEQYPVHGIELIYPDGTVKSIVFANPSSSQ